MLLHLKFNLLFHLNLVLNIISICCWILCTFGFESPLNLHFYLTLVWCWISLPFGVLSGQFGDTISIISISCWISFLFAGVLTRIGLLNLTSISCWISLPFGVESPFHLVLNLTSVFVKSDSCLVLNLSQVWCWISLVLSWISSQYAVESQVLYIVSP